MSLVEKALSKMKQAERAAAQAEPQRTEAPAATVEPAGAPASQAVEARVAPAPEARPAPSAPSARSGKVVQVDLDVLRSHGYLPPEPQEHELIEQYRHIKRPLVARALGQSGGEHTERAAVVMVTSALPKEGKTFTALNLTRALARERDASVLLVDADVNAPTISRVFGLQGESGLIDALADRRVDVESLVLQSSIPGLQILPSGHRSDTGAELFSSRRMDDIIARLLAARPDRIVLLDSPPLLVTNEGKALLRIAGQVVLVVQADVTSQSAVLEALEFVDEGKSVGLVLNQCEQAVGLGHRYYGGTYGYGRAEAPAREPA
jgi:exopolysaccharide/PEP-CTERM locus tyrosine autokinase